MTAPNGGEVLFAGVLFIISWTATDDFGVTDIDLDYSLDNGSSWTPIAACQNLSGTATSCLWNTTGLTTSGLTARVRVRAHDAVGHEGSDTSNAGFQLKAGTPYATLTLPDTAVSWQAGTTKRVRFIHNLGKNQPVAVEIDRNYPSGVWSPVTGTGCALTTAASSCVCQWPVSGATNGATARIRVRSLGFAAATDVGNASFTITKRVQVTQPNTAVSWKVGTLKTVKWTHNLGLGSTFDITLDNDGDLDCDDAVIASGVPASTATAGTYLWSVSGTATRTASASHVLSPTPTARTRATRRSPPRRRPAAA